MKVAIYSPYLDTLGGGERYMMTIAQVLSSGNTVDVLLDSHLYSFGKEKLKKDLEKRFNLDLLRVEFKKAPIGKGASFINRLFFLSSYDLLFYLTDGSIFYSTAKRNILHIQSPIVGQPAKSLWGKIKLSGWDLIIYNSKFTQSNAEKKWPKKSTVIYPPVDVMKIKPLQKKKYILSVGRFFGYLKDKKHGVLIDAFKKLQPDSNLDNWSLHLVGSAAEGDKNYLDDLKNKAKGLDVRFYPNLSYDELIKLYGESSIYWHASGYQEDDSTKMEHFGISTVEAMAAGCVPVVIAQGGQKEIVEHGQSGLLWKNLSELEILTKRLINEVKLWKDLSIKSKIRAKVFSKEKFSEKINQIIV